ncbi:MAG TPA: trigger factor, partial [Rhodocyclaceae bacterium]|nr:trigger factor [Rhodocyclaceae bacterium]
ERPVFAVGETEVEHTLEVLRKQRAVFEKTDRASEEGDRVVIDFVGRKDGVVFDGGQANDFPVVVGGGQMVADFDAQLHGISAGDHKTFDVTFPADYQAANLAGQTAQFEITVKSVEAGRVPAVDAEFAKTMGVPDGDVAKMRAEIKTNLEREVKRRIRTRVRDQILDALIAVSDFEVPKSLVEAESQRMAEAAKQDLVKRGIDAKNVPVESAWFVEQATRRVRLGLAVAEVVEINGLQAKPEQLRAHVEELAQSYEQPQDVIRWYHSKPENMRNIEETVIEGNVIDWVLSKAKVSDKVIAFQELMAQGS